MAYSAEPEIHVAKRAGGKTTRAIEWLRGGERCPGYPGWTRVLVVTNQVMALELRGQFEDEWEDISHRIYFLKEWVQSRGGAPDTEVFLDNADLMIPRMSGIIVGMSLTGTLAQPETARERMLHIDPHEHPAAHRAAFTEAVEEAGADRERRRAASHSVQVLSGTATVSVDGGSAITVTSGDTIHLDPPQ